MLTPIYTGQFGRDVKKAQKRGKDLDKLKTIVSKIIHQETLDPKYKDHKLVGSFAGRRDCHIEPDWLLIYKLEKERVIFERTGTHSDSFR